MRGVALTLLAACSYEAPPELPSGGEPDAPVGPDACVSFSSMVDSCALPAGDPLTLTGNLTFDTNTGDLFDGPTPIAVDTMTLVTPAGEIKAILASTIVVESGAVIRADGARGFAMIASESIRLAATSLIDVSIKGAGARDACPSMAAVGANRDGGAGGGGGGGFGGPGGVGGAGDADASSAAPGGLGGSAIVIPDGILGGCPGAAGGNDNNDDGGRGGVAGGAVYLAAGSRIEILGGIDAAGEGGRGGDQHLAFNGDAGGGGGGSGGMIVLEAPTVAVSGTLAANGGGGGEGSGNAQAGNAGARGTFGTERAGGGAGSSGTGTDGGSGGATPDRAGGSVGTPQNGAGGGGGGGAGIIRIIAPMREITGAVSPDPA